MCNNGGLDHAHFSYSNGQDGHFSIQYNTGTGKHDFFYGTSNPPSYITSRDLDIGGNDAEWVLCGGETATGLAGMGDTRCGNGGSNGLQYQASAGSSFTTWGSHTSWREDPPYRTVYINAHNFSAEGNE